MKKTIASILLSFTITSCFSSSPSQLQIAEELSRQKKYPEAIEAYKHHIQDRLKVKDRPEWENPYFYLILIGDIELGLNEPDKAYQNYLEAEKENVDNYLVSDRFRSVAKWYEDQKNYDKAIEILLKHKDKDALLFEAMLDRINKLKTLQEDQGH